MRFKQFFYIPPHTVQRFRERVAALPTRKIRTIIQAALQDNTQLVGVQTWDKSPSVVYFARYRDKSYQIIVTREIKKQNNVCPVVRTILVGEMETKTQYKRRGWDWNL